MPKDRVVLHNANWNKVKIEARKGNNQDPESNPSLGGQRLARNQDWAIESDGESVFYRRDKDPDYPNGEWTEWIERPCYGTGQTYTENI